MVPLLLLMNAATQRGRLAGLRRCLKTLLIMLGIAFLVLTAQAQTRYEYGVDNAGQHHHSRYSGRVHTCP